MRSSLSTFSRLGKKVLALFVLIASPAWAHSYTAIVGATLIDVSQGGRGSADIADSVVLIDRDDVAAVGRRGRLGLPHQTRIILASGKFLVPGLIDGFGAIRDARFAAAYLHQGVTTVHVPLSPPGGRIDGEDKILRLARPSVLTSAPISGYATDGSVPPASAWAQHASSDRPLTDAQLVAEVDAAAAAGNHSIGIGPDVRPDQLATIARRARKHGLAIFAEPAFAPYDAAIEAGVGAFMRNDKYQLWLAGPAAWAEYRANPIGGGGRTAMRTICGGADGVDSAVDDFARQLGGTFLMPILVMEATADDVGGPNPWSLPAARFFRPADLDDPVDPVTGARPYLAQHPERAEAIRACARRKQAIDGRLHRAGAIYLAGSAAPSFGILPGSGLHVELRLLRDIGLSPREVLAAATGNYARLFLDRGIIAAGRRADLLLLDRDPRADVAALDRISLVMAGGWVIDRRALEQSCGLSREAGPRCSEVGKRNP